MDVTLTGSGANASVETQVDPTHSSLRVNVRPTEYRQGTLIGGHYKMSMTTSNTAGGPAAGSDIFALRWTDTRMLCKITRVNISAATTTAFTTAQAVDAALYRATGFTVNYSTAITAVVPSAISQRMFSNMMGASLLNSTGQVVITSGAAMTGATRTLDTQPVGYGPIVAATAVGTIGNVDLFETRDFGEHPLVLTANEGIVIQNGIALGAAGVVKFGVTLEWAELPNYA